MSELRRPVRAVIDLLMAESEDAREVALDRVGEVVGAQAFSSDEVEAIIAALEDAGRNVTAPRASARNDLQSVILAARSLERETGCRPSVEAIALRTGLSTDAVRQALTLGRVMGR